MAILIHNDNVTHIKDGNFPNSILVKTMFQGILMEILGTDGRDGHKWETNDKMLLKTFWEDLRFRFEQHEMEIADNIQVYFPDGKIGEVIFTVNGVYVDGNYKLRHGDMIICRLKNEPKRKKLKD